jgi:hypothetical protein
MSLDEFFDGAPVLAAEALARDRPGARMDRDEIVYPFRVQPPQESDCDLGIVAKRDLLAQLSVCYNHVIT